MSLLDRLLKSDVAKLEEPETGKVKSKRLGKVIGSKEAVEVTVKEIPSKRINELMARQFDKKGKLDFSKNYRVKALIVAEGMVEPRLTDKDLLAHFGCETSADLAEKLFGQELTKISDVILSLSGVETNNDGEDEDEEEKETKNS